MDTTQQPTILPPMKEPFTIIRNAIKCVHCHKLIVSLHRHHSVKCECGKVGVDGGLDYNKRSGNPEDYKNESIYQDAHKLYFTSEEVEAYWARKQAEEERMKIEANKRPITIGHKQMEEELRKYIVHVEAIISEVNAKKLTGIIDSGGVLIILSQDGTSHLFPHDFPILPL